MAESGFFCKKPAFCSCAIRHHNYAQFAKSLDKRFFTENSQMAKKEKRAKPCQTFLVFS
jgi:hypothetical protein